MAMRVTFVRTRGARDRVYVARDDGSEASWETASYGEGLPHDLVHLVVESRFGVTRGVWGRVASGAELGRINAAANRRGGRDKYGELGGEPEELLVAEALANAPWLVVEVAPRAEDVQHAIEVELGKLGRAHAESITIAAVGAVRDELREWLAKWRALGERGALTFEYPLP